MATFKVETKNKVDIDKKPRVYFTCHPNDFERYFKKICDDIFKTHDCAIYYTEDMTEVIAEDDKQVDLGRNNLFVVPVTFKLLTMPNRAMDEDIPYALKEHIPVLPIMMEPSIDEFYSKPDKFGELQYLTPYSTDLTEISYEEKLKKYLESVLISDELAKRVRAAFDAYIFLSYRKKDRKYANELMRLIHSIPECRDIAIWFDEFLTPGESFKENIERILDDCKLFTLLVTPQLLEKVIDANGEERDNYVISTELPLARKKKEEKDTDIFAVEMEKTDKQALANIHIYDCVNPQDTAFHARFIDALARMARSTNGTPEHNFLIGLAYLEGIDVEIDRQRGLELITAAAEADLLEAIEHLYRMYSKGIGVGIDYSEAVKWALRSATFHKQLYGEEDARTIWALNTLANAHLDNGQYEAALNVSEQVCALSVSCFGEDSIDYVVHLNTLSIIYDKLDDPQKALTLCEQAYAIVERALPSDDFMRIIVLRTMSLALDGIGHYRKALKMALKVYDLYCQTLGERDPDTIEQLNNVAAMYASLRRPFKAVKTLEKACTDLSQVLGDEHPKTLFCISNLATLYMRVWKYKKALEICRKTYALRCRMLGKEHPDTRYSLRGLYLACMLTGHFREGWRYSELYDATALSERDTNNISHKYNASRKKHITEKLIEKIRYIK